MPNPGPASTITPNYLNMGNSADGQLIGSLSTTPVGLFGATPTPQRSNANQISVSQAAAGTVISANTFAFSPNGVGTSQSQTQSLTVTSASPFVQGDFLIVNKPSAQTGLGIVGSRISTATIVSLNYVNLTAATITPTASESYSFVGLRGLTNTMSVTPSAISANTVATQTFSVTGLAVGMLVAVAPTLEQLNIGIAGARVVSNNTLAIDFINVSAAPITPNAQSYTYFAGNGLNANSNIMILGANVATALAAVVTTVTSTWVAIEQTITVSSILATDIIIGVSKPTFQANLGIVGSRITTANILGVTFATGSITGVTPTSSEAYNVTLYRSAPPAPLSLFTVTCAPTSVAANSSSEQFFTVSGVAANSVLWVNKLTATPGLGIGGCRVTAANTVSINFINPTSAAIVPPTEPYLFGNFQPLPNTGSYYIQQASIGLNASVNLSNELRTTLVNLGPITGG